MKKLNKLFDAKLEDGLFFAPLGGVGEIGMNCALYGCDGQWIVIDLGASFDNRLAPGSDVIIPDLLPAGEVPDNLLAVLVTHAHEDHLGAIPYLARKLNLPIHASPFAKALLDYKLREMKIKASIRPVEAGRVFTVGPFKIEYIPMTHSTPEAHSLALTTRYGTIIHSGDWKLDPEPGLGELSDRKRLKELGEAGIHAVICDSTNVMTRGRAGSEGKVARRLAAIIPACTGRVIVTLFASNVARIAAVIDAAEKAGREVVLAGRSMQRMVTVARETGYLDDRMSLYDLRDLDRLNEKRVLVLCSGNQGEPRATLTRAISGDHPRLRVKKEDTVIFSSRIIPGNERAVGNLLNGLARIGARAVTWNEEPNIHVSGHPGEAELRNYYEMLRPTIAVPVHGETIHLTRHIELARKFGIPHPVLVHNGDILRLAPMPVQVEGRMETDRLAVDGTRLIPIDGTIIRERRKLSWSGGVGATLFFGDSDEVDSEPASGLIVSFGLVEDHDRPAFEAWLSEEMISFAYRLPAKTRDDDEALMQVVSRRVRQLVEQRLDKMPLVQTRVLRYGETPSPGRLEQIQAR